jgi:hypothetical protein
VAACGDGGQEDVVGDWAGGRVGAGARRTSRQDRVPYRERRQEEQGGGGRNAKAWERRTW